MLAPVEQSKVHPLTGVRLPNVHCGFSRVSCFESVVQASWGSPVLVSNLQQGMNRRLNGRQLPKKYEGHPLDFAPPTGPIAKATLIFCLPTKLPYPGKKPLGQTNARPGAGRSDDSISTCAKKTAILLPASPSKRIFR